MYLERVGRHSALRVFTARTPNCLVRCTATQRLEHIRNSLGRADTAKVFVGCGTRLADVCVIQRINELFIRLLVI